jgi:hypothetical protein
MLQHAVKSSAPIIVGRIANLTLAILPYFGLVDKGNTVENV